MWMGCRDGRKAAFISFPSTKLIAIVKQLFNTAVQLLPVSHRFPSHDQVKMCLTKTWICFFVHNKLITRIDKAQIITRGQTFSQQLVKAFQPASHCWTDQESKKKKNLHEYHLLQIRSQFAFFFVTLHLEAVWGIKKRGKIFGDT